MDTDRQLSSYSWHQSHDQATVLLLVPYETLPEDVMVVIEQNYLVAGIRGQVPIIKGRLYGNVDTSTSMWQLEPRPSTRERTTSAASTLSTQSSYAYVSDPEISSSFAASLESGHASDNDDYDFHSPERSNPASRDEQITIPSFPQRASTSHPTSPRIPTSMTSSFSSIDSYQTGRSGRLLTLYLEKDEPAIWPSLVVGPVPESFSPITTGPFVSDLDFESKYNLDATSLGLMGEEFFDIRQDREEAFECFVRAWHQAHTPLSTLRLASHFVPIQSVIPEASATPSSLPSRGSLDYYVYCLGGPDGLARLYLDAGLLYLEGSATALMSSTYSALSSIRTAEPRSIPVGEAGTQAWKRDRDTARRYFDKARQLAPELDVPFLPTEHEPRSGRGRDVPEQELQMPSIDVEEGGTLRPETLPPKEEEEISSTLRLRRRRQAPAPEALLAHANDEEDNTWYLYLPGIIGAGTALLVVGVVSALSFSSWRKNQN